MPNEEAWSGVRSRGGRDWGGRLTIIDMKNNLIRGIRKASDFDGAAAHRRILPEALPNLPAVCLPSPPGRPDGHRCGDRADGITRCRSKKWPAQTLVAELGEPRRPARVRRGAEVLDEHWRTGARSAASGRAPPPRGARQFIGLVDPRRCAIAYRKRMVDSPAYRLNHEEVIKALEEGITFTENLNPLEAVADDRGALKAVIFNREAKDLPAGQDRVLTLPARTMLVAAGTSPNIMYEKECKGTFLLDSKKKFFQPHSVKANGDGKFHLEADVNGFFTSYDTTGSSHLLRRQPSRYAGNVVKAMASAMDSPTSEAFAKELATLDAAARPGVTRHGSVCASGSDTDSSPSSKTWSG
jgi:hypothetical protein